MTKFVLAQPELEDSVLTLLQKTKGNKDGAKIIEVKIDHKVFLGFLAYFFLDLEGDKDQRFPIAV